MSLENGEPVYGARVRTFSTTVVQLLGQAGLDYAYLDLEHAGFSPYDTEKINRRVTVAEQEDLEIIVRLPSENPAIVRKVLDSGVRTVLIPRVEQASEVERAVRASRFHYDGEPGERGFGTSPSNNWGIRPEGYTQEEDTQTLVGIMLETRSALENAEEILSVPKVGFAKIGVGDLAVSMGCPQDYENDAVQGAITTFREQCRINDIPVGVGVSSRSAAIEAVQDGYRLVDIGGDVEILRTTLEDRLKSIRSA